MSNVLLENESVRESAYWLYVAGTEPSDIAKKLRVDLSTLEILIQGVDYKSTDKKCWAMQKASLNATSVSVFLNTKVEVLENINGYGVMILENEMKKYLKASKESSETLPIKDLDAISRIVTNLDKISRLESGKATEIHGNIPSTAQEVMDSLRSDPCYGALLADAKMISELGIPHVEDDNLTEVI